MAFGTLRRDSYFTPGEVLDEATQMDNAVRALAAILGNHVDDPAFTPDFLSGWNAFVDNWRDFWGQCNSWTGWLFRAKDSSRDELLDLEDSYTDLKGQVDSLISSSSDAGATDSLPDVNPESARTVDNVSSAADAAESEAGNLLTKPLQAAEDIGWQTIAGALLVVAGLVTAVVILHKHGGLRVVPVPL